MAEDEDGQDPKLLNNLILIAEELDNRTEGDEVSHALDSLVDDVFAVEASKVNLGGYVKQLTFLVNSGIASEALDALKELHQELAVVTTE